MDTKTKIEVKKLEIAEEKGIKGFIKSKQTRRTIIAILIGAVAALAFYYITEAQSIDAFSMNEALKNMALGAFLGFFVTNSPCARGRC
ncbi:MAG TPA: hypothetical protein VJ919_06860 [Tangfeifania sp.]|nr:hypothetical protein [Tangfeifania sp.]